MSEVPREFYRLDELAERWNRSVEIVVQMAAIGKLSLSCFFNGKYKGVVCKQGEDPGHAELENIIGRLENQTDRLYVGFINLSLPEAKGIAANCFNRGQSYETNIIHIADGDWRLTRGDWLMLSDDEYTEKNRNIEIESSLSFNTFVKFADMAGITIEKTEGANPQNRIKKSDIRRVVRFRKDYLKKNKK